MPDLCGAAGADPFNGEQLADVCRWLLRASVTNRWPEPPQLVGLPWNDPWHIDDHGFDVEILALATAREPLEVLCRLEDRPENVALAMVADGWARTANDRRHIDWDRLHADGPSPSRDQRGRRVRVVHAVARSGATAVALAPNGAATAESAYGVDDGAAAGDPAGPWCDGLRRVFGLATPPCPVRMIEALTILWLEAVLQSPSGVRTWEDVVALHPEAATRRSPGAARVGPETIEAAGRSCAGSVGWADFHALAARTGWASITPSVAAWADQGMFARLVLRELPPLWLVVGQVIERLGPEVGRTLRRLLARWGLEPDGLAA